MERIGFLINKLKEQYEKADNQESMLVTLQMLYRELMPKMDRNPAVGSVSVVVPGQMDQTFLEKNMGERFALDVAPNTAGKQVFELSVAPQEIVKPIEKLPAIEAKPIDKQPITTTEPPKNPFVVASPKIEPTILKTEPILPKVEPVVVKDEPALPQLPKKEEPVPAKKIDEQQEINARFMPSQPKPVAAPALSPSIPPPPQKNAPAAPPKEIHESIQLEQQPSLNDKIEKRQPELFHTLKAEPLKDLKRAISINERFQYINHLFMKDETMYERSLKTINSFNVLSEASFWIRKELATKMGWKDDDELVQQFMQLVERRFS
jgi:hypothetical protein